MRSVASTRAPSRPGPKPVRCSRSLAGHQPAELSSFGRLERAERAAQQRDGLVERLRRERRQPPIDDRPQIGVVDQHRAAAGEEPLDERGADRRWRAGRQRPAEPLFDLRLCQ